MTRTHSSRSATLNRRTAETDIDGHWDLDRAAAAEIDTGIGFFDHMLQTLGKHSATTIHLRCRGDLHVDGHHTTEDSGLVLGGCLREALGERRGIERFGHIAVPLDEALVEATIDISGRPYLAWDVAIPGSRIGEWDTELVPEFFAALCDQSRICLHLHLRCGRNSHHIVEAAFKATARALRQAIRVTGNEIPSTKGMLG